MGRFAWRNLLTRPLRTALALVGLSIPILGVLGLFSISGGLRDLVGDTLGKIQGVMVLRDNAPVPALSKLKASDRARIEAVPGVRVVAPEVWDLSPAINGVYTFGKTAADYLSGGKSKAMSSLLDAPVVQGQDIPSHHKLRSGVYPTALKQHGQGRFLDLPDAGTNHIVISRKIAKAYPRADGKPLAPGDTMTIGEKPFEVVGVYETGSMFLDDVIVMDIETARSLLNIPKDLVSSFYVEMDDPTRVDAVAEEIERLVPGVNARTMNEFLANFGMLMGQLDKFLLMTISLALAVGIVGIVNTMLMSTTERFVEFGVLRTLGWSKRNVLTLVTTESALLGLLSGAIGCVLAYAGVAVANQFLGGGLRLAMPPWLFALGVGLSMLTGTLGGLYPAWRASKLVPMDAIRLGSR